MAPNRIIIDTDPVCFPPPQLILDIDVKFGGTLS
jgi:hypothetical protein